MNILEMIKMASKITEPLLQRVWAQKLMSELSGVVPAAFGTPYPPYVSFKNATRSTVSRMKEYMSSKRNLHTWCESRGQDV